MRDRYRTVAGESRHEPPPTKGSRFVAAVAPAADAADAAAFVERVRAELPGATHHVFAYRLGPGGEAFRASDDGEPAGSAGRPVLAQIEGHDLSDVVVVVTRWFGGTKLGVGGLVRAYGGAAGQALDRAAVRVVPITRRLRVRHPYECSGAIRGLLAAHALTPEAAEYGETVRLEVAVPVAALDAFVRELADRTGGRATAAEAGPEEHEA